MAQSVSSGSSSSVSSSSLLPNPQTDLTTQIAQIAAQIGQMQYSWAQQQYGRTQALTDADIGHLMSSATTANDLALNNIQRYERTFQPLEDQLISDANSYNSEGRKRFEMGAAEANAGQTMDQGRLNAEKALQSFGVNPNSGRYEELERSSALERAAAQASAGQAARYNTENVGRNLRSQAIQVGQQYPGQAVNALGAEVGALGSAANAAIGTLNSGTNAMASANPFLGTAMSLRPPPTGQQSRSSSQQQGTSSSPDRQQQQGPGGPGGNPTGPGGNPYAPGASPPNMGSVNPGQFSWPGAGIMKGPDAPGGDDPGASNPGSMAWGPQYDQYDPNYQSYGSPTDQPSWDQAVSGADPSLWSDYQYQPASYDAGPASYAAYQPSGDFPSWDTSPSGGYDTSGYDASSYAADDSYGFAKGGAIPASVPHAPGFADARQGGHVPAAASPSMGQNTDDITAKVNAGEFVIPKDVAAWKGHEFFQNLIQKARKARVTAPAHGNTAQGARPAQRPPMRRPMPGAMRQMPQMQGAI